MAMFLQYCFEFFKELWIDDVLTGAMSRFDMCSRSNETVTYDKTWFSWFCTTWNIFKRYCKSTRLKLTYCLSRYNLATLMIPVVFSLKSPSLHPYCSMPHLDSHILGRFSAIVLTFPSLRMRKFDPYLYGSEFHEGLLVSSGLESDGEIFSPVFVDEKMRRSRTVFASNAGVTVSTLKLQVSHSGSLTSLGGTVVSRRLVADIVDQSEGQLTRSSSLMLGEKIGANHVISLGALKYDFVWSWCIYQS